MSNRVKIGMGQLLVEGGEPERNLSRAEKMIEEAAGKGCNIILLPETSVGYIFGGPYIGKKSIRCSLVVDRNGIITKGPHNEFAGELVLADIEMPPKRRLGTSAEEVIYKT